MELEKRLWREIERTLSTTTTATLSLKTLRLFQSLITNPTTSAATITTVHQTLTTALSLSLHPQTHIHILSLLSNVALPASSTAIATATAATTLISSSSARLAASALSLLLATSGFDFDSVDDSVVISICFRPCVPVRVWFLNNADGFKIRPNLLVTVFLGFTKDPYPNIRQAALIGLARVCESGVVIEDCDVVELCYFRAVELLSDQEDYVRQSAVRVSGEWGRMVAAFKQEGLQKDWFDAVFLQLCSTVRDMNVGVRVEAFNALGKFTCVSEDILLQALSKKVLGTVKGKQYLALRDGQYKIHASSAAGVFIHGLEDDFSEVQQAACITLRMLPVVSGQFAGEAVNIVSYVLNDDSIHVRLEALKTLHHMSTSGCLKMKEEHLDMLLGTLVDSCLKIRSKAISIVGSLKLPTLKFSKMTVESLLATLDMYPKSEADIFRALLSMGQTNGHNAVSIIDDFYSEVETVDDVKFVCNNNRVAGLIILALSTSLKHEDYRHRIPQKIFSYAAAFFGRISLAFADILDADSLLQYLSHCGNWCSESQPVECPAPKDQLQSPVPILDAVKIILATVKSLWGLVKSGCNSEVLGPLRYCQGSLKTLRPDSIECAGAVVFALQYIRVVKLISKIWEHFIPSNLNQVGHLDILVAKLEKSLLNLRFGFTGFGEEDELYLLELVLLSHVLTLSGVHVHCRVLHKLLNTIAYVEHLKTTSSIAFSNFLDLLSNFTSKYDQAFSKPSDLKKLRDAFVLKDFALTQKIRQVTADVAVVGFDSVTPLRFIPGLPVGVPLEINLYNVVRTDHVTWIKLALVDEVTEFVYLDTEELGGLQQIKFTSPFFRTPKCVGFTLRVSIGIECKSEDLHLAKGYGGPEHSLAYISPELEVHFVCYG